MNLIKAKESIIKIIQSDSHIPIYLHSSPGIGKSSLCKDISKKLNFHFIDVRLTMMTPSDILGIPFPNKDHTKAIWLPPSIFPSEKSKDKYLILFDELSNASMIMQNCSYRLILDRSLGDHYKLPEGAKIIAAGNKIMDNSGVQKLSKALANRFIHFDIEADVESWKKWAYQNNIDERVIGFINFKSNMLSQTPTIEELVFATPRQWSYVSKLLGQGIIDEEVIEGSIGKGAALEFFSYLEVYDKLPSVEDILKGRNVEIPKEPSILYALASSLVIRANKNNISNIFKFCEKIPQEYHILIIRDIVRRDETIVDAYSKIEKWLDKYNKFFE